MRDFAPLTAFKVRSYRFQWPADLCSTWSFEMENIILGWYILVETGSVLLLTLFAALQFMGTLVAPWLGVLGDRIGRKIVFCAMRAIFSLLAITIMTLAFLDLLTPYVVLVLALLSGLLRPSDMVMRQALIGDTVPPESLPNALGLNRTSMDASRVFGALAGAGIFAVLGIGYAYVLVAAIYLVSFSLTLGITNTHPADSAVEKQETSQWRDFKEGLAYIWNTPMVLAILWLAFLVNLTAFPIIRGLLPYVAKEVYLVDEIGLGHLVAGFGAGAMIGSLVVAAAGSRTHSTKFMLTNVFLWYAMLAVFAAMETKLSGFVSLFIMGIVHAMGMVSMSVILVSQLEPYIRGRVIGVRILAIYGVPLGLLGTGFLIDVIGFQATVNLYVSIGVALTALIWFKWRKVL
ncbi:MAG: MFS transporter [Rhodospirillaceae bacterium]|jgi:MFS family permease|nr:MFS transporter [Rhodospirillaceae bacterium]